MTLTVCPPQVSRRLLSKPQDALEGVVLSVSGAALATQQRWGWGLCFCTALGGLARQQSVPQTQRPISW